MNKQVKFGDHLMSVLQTLGNPHKEYFKAQKLFLNYLELGIDVMFEHQELVVTKIVVHLNQPKQSDFCFYDRVDCHLTLEKNSSNAELKSSGKPDSELQAYLYDKMHQPEQDK